MPENKDIIEEIKELIEERVSVALKGIDIPKNFTLDMVNSPEIKVEMPKLDFSGLEKSLKTILERERPEPTKVDMSSVERLLSEVSDQLQENLEKDNSALFKDLIKAVNDNKPLPVDFTELQEKLEEFSKEIRKGFGRQIIAGGGPNSVNLQDQQGTVINPVSRDLQVDVSSATILNNGESWDTGWVDRQGYAGIKVAVTTDQNMTYTIKYSPDEYGTDATDDSTLTRHYRTTQIEVPHKFENMRRYIKVTFTNDSGSNQTFFRPDISLTNSAGVLNIPTDSTMSQDYDSISTRPTNTKYEIALGRRQGYGLWNKFGYNADVDTTTDPEVVAAFGGAFTVLTTASTLTIVSSSDEDSDTGGMVAQGNGARTIRVIGVDANRNEQTEDITMDGTTSVATTTTWLGINRALVLTSGSSDGNVGTITITATTGGSTQATIPAGESVTQQLIFFNYANHQALAEWMKLSAKRFGSGTEPVVTFKGWVYSPLTDTKYEVFREIVDASDETHSDMSPPLPFVFTEQDVFWVEAETTRDDTQVLGRFSLVTVRDVDA